jgi:hypothetical protein
MAVDRVLIMDLLLLIQVVGLFIKKQVVQLMDIVFLMSVDLVDNKIVGTGFLHRYFLVVMLVFFIHVESAPI